MYRLSLILLVTCMKACCLWELSKAENCPAYYRRFSTEHTYCLPPNKTCNIVKSVVDTNSIQIILKEHNKYRNMVAMGQETIGPLPKATNMLQMVWDDELAAIAQKHADQCKFAHDAALQRETKNFHVGQNLYLQPGLKEITEPRWKEAIDAWTAQEVPVFDMAVIPAYTPMTSKGAIGHLTQAIWAESWKIGCGYTAFKDGDSHTELYTCDYGPAGNMVEAAIYKIGEACSDCPINSCCGKTCPQAEYPGLCKLTDDKGPQYINNAQANASFFCNFQPESMCKYNTTSSTSKGWEITDTASGSYIGIILEGGQNATFNLANTLKCENPSCFKTRFRKGPNVAEEAPADLGIVIGHFVWKDSKVNSTIEFKDAEDFVSSLMSLYWDEDFSVFFTFSVPVGNPAQFFEIQDFTFTKGKC